MYLYFALGGVGWAATQLAKTVSDVTIFGTASSHKHELITQNGVDFPIHHEQVCFYPVIWSLFLIDMICIVNFMKFLCCRLSKYHFLHLNLNFGKYSSF